MIPAVSRPLTLRLILVSAGLAVVAALASLLIAAQDAPELGGAAASGQIKANELLVISLEGLIAPGVETRLVRRVGAEGEIWLPVLDEQPVTTREQTPGQLQAEIRRAYQRRGVRLDVVAVGRQEMGEDQQLVLPEPPTAPRR